MKMIPWAIALMSSLIALVGWSKVHRLNKQNDKLQTSFLLQQAKSNRILEKHLEPQVGALKDNTQIDFKTRSDSDSLADQQPTNRLQQQSDCLQDPQVQQVIYRKAEELSDWISEQKLQEKIRVKRDEKLEQIFDSYDKKEEHFSNAVYRFAETHQLEDAVVVQLQQIVEQGFNSQRDILARFQDDEISQQEAKRQGRESREIDKEAVIDLLGEEGARAFSAVVKGEYDGD